MLTQSTQTGGFAASPASWSLLLVAGFAIAYPILATNLIGSQRQSMIKSQLTAQVQAAHAVRSYIKCVGYNRDKLASQLEETRQLINTDNLGSPLGIAVVASDGSIIDKTVDFPLTELNSLSSCNVLLYPDQQELQFSTALAGSPGWGGELQLPLGARPQILISVDYSAADTWQIAVLSRMESINAELHLSRLYLLISFLCLAVLLLLLILVFYLSLAAGLSSAIRSATALEEATVRFQESIGEFRRPLHNIQGLADMLAITEDPDERNGYLKEIKGEVSRIIHGLETSDP